MTWEIHQLNPERCPGAADPSKPDDGADKLAENPKGFGRDAETH
jgi:hypothetical protein